MLQIARIMYHIRLHDRLNCVYLPIDLAALASALALAAARLA